MKFSYLKNIPLSVYNCSIKKAAYNYSKNLKLIFALRGNIIIEGIGKKDLLGEGGVILLNSSSIYSLDGSPENEVCILEIDTNYFNTDFEGLSNLKFSLNYNQYIYNQREEIRLLWSYLYKTIDILCKAEKGHELKIKGIIIELILLLVNKYQDRNFDRKTTINAEEKRLKSIIEFINCHYKEKISLTKIADMVELNPQYLSRYFPKYMGITLNEYITKIRLRESLVDLRDFNNTITYVALENGFSNIKSYFKAFKKNYNTTPAVFRKNDLINPEIKIEKSNIKDVELINLVKIYSNIDNKRIKAFPEEREEYEIYFKGTKEEVKKSWRKLAAFGRAAEGLRGEWRNQLRNIQNDIPFEYIRFHGIFSDDMMVYSEDSDGNPEYNFSYVDELIDFFMEVKIKPFIELGFMPEKLAAEKRLVFNWNANMSFPKDMNKWKELIENFLLHLLQRYGIKEVNTWYFEIWDGFIHGETNLEKSLEFFKETYLSVKKINNNLKVGGVNSHLEEMINTNLLEVYDIFCTKENIVLDFISGKAYAVEPEDKNESISSLMAKINNNAKDKAIFQDSLKYSIYSNQNYISNNIDMVFEKLKKSRTLNKSLFLTEWNNIPDPRDLLHDTCYKSAFLVKNIIENFNKVEGLGYWTFTDIFEEVKNTNKTTFHGGVGFVTINGLKKPIYHAYSFLNKLGERIIEKGENYIITQKADESIQILVSNYCHFKSDRTKCIPKEVTLTEREAVFNNTIKDIVFRLSDLKGEFIKKTYKLNSENGSVYDEWVKMGGTEKLYTEEIRYLKEKSIFAYKREVIYSDKNLFINEKMAPQEVMLIELEYPLF
jgi:xylan 1,4-beta-xylosidase